MIKSAQIENLKKEDFHYITTISKSQIESLINKDVLQLELFQDTLCEVIIPEEGIRYVLRRNPTRAEELTKNCQEKINFIQKKVHLANTYLVDHPKAKIETQEKHLQSLIN
jgi:predicted PilT family ATPase